MSRLQGKVALVTGAARGLGASIASRFHAEGASVLLTDVLDAEGQALAKSLGKNALYQSLDVTSEDGWQAAMAKVQEAFGRLDILVNNAGVLRVGPLETLALADYMRTIQINQVGCFLGMRSAIEPMRAAGGGAIVNIASTAGLEGVAYALDYAASKHAVIGMTKTAALELANSGIRVNAICPGGMATWLVADVLSMSRDEVQSMPTTANPMGRMSHTDEVAGTALFLASSDASFTTGAAVLADGGQMAGLVANFAPSV